MYSVIRYSYSVERTTVTLLLSVECLGIIDHVGAWLGS